MGQIHAVITYKFYIKVNTEDHFAQLLRICQDHHCDVTELNIPENFPNRNLSVRFFKKREWLNVSEILKQGHISHDRIKYATVHHLDD